MTPIDVQSQLEVEICRTCGVLFAMPVTFQDMRREDERVFYCPSGHGQRYHAVADDETTPPPAHGGK